MVSPPLYSILLLFLVLFTSTDLIRAEYYIDDADTKSVKADSSWGLFTSPKSLTFLLPNGTTSVDPSPCYGQTYTAGICTTDQECKLRILFTGSGITVYILQAGPYGVNMSVSVDGGSPTVTTLNAPPPPNYYRLNVSIFDIQSLPSTDHVLHLNALSYDRNWSPILFDFAIVDETFVRAPLRLFGRASESTTAAPWTSPTSIPIPSSRRNNAAVIGGATAGAVVLVLSIVAFFYFWRRKPRSVPVPINLDSELKTSSQYPNLMSETPYTVLPFVPNPGQASLPIPSSHIETVQRSTQPSDTAVSNATFSELPPPPSLPVPGASQLTPEQVNFVYNLYTQNVPAPTLAHVVETLANPGSSQDRSPGLETAPPEYSTLQTNTESSQEGSSGMRRRQHIQGQSDKGRTLVKGNSEDVLERGPG